MDGAQPDWMAKGLEDAEKRVVRWDEQLLMLPANTLSRRGRWIAIAACILVIAGWSAVLNGNLMIAWGLPDVAYYVKMAHGRYDLVPQPFSARPLAPLLARGIAAVFGCWVEGGFAAVAIASVLWAAGTVFWLLSQRPVPRWMLLAVAVAPFWPQLVRDAGLPDPLYAALLATLLLALDRRWLTLAAGLMLPLMLARESTSLTLVCLLLVTWREMRWAVKGLAVAGVVLGAAIVHKLSAGGLSNPEHLGAGAYIVGKVLSNGVRSVGIVPWSNVYPMLCGAPAWSMRLHVGAVERVGVCTWSAYPLLGAISGMLTVFGALPLMVLFGFRAWRKAGRGDLLVRFCALYGGVSFLLAPALGTWYERLFGYGWPLLLVAAPLWVGAVSLPSSGRGGFGRGFALWGSLLVAHILASAVAFTGPALPTLQREMTVQIVALALVLVLMNQGDRVRKAG